MENPNSSSVLQIKNKNRRQRVNNTNNPRMSRRELNGKCFQCGSYDHKKGDECPKRHLTCHNCGIKGHISSVCLAPGKNKRLGNGSRNQSRSQSRNQSRANSPNRNNLAATINAVCKIGSHSTPRIEIIFKSVNSSSTPFRFSALPDTGATRTIVSYDIVKMYGISIDRSHEERLYAANKRRMSCEGSVKLYASIKDQKQVYIDAAISSALENEIVIS